MKIGFLFCLAFFILSCTGEKKITDADRNTAEIVLDDFKMTAAPNELDRAGFIFAVGKDNVQVPVTYLDATPADGQTKLRTYKETRNITVGTLVNFLGSTKLDLTANAGINDSSKIVTGMDFEGTTWSRLLLLDIDSKLTDKKNLIMAAMKRQGFEKSKFYLIVESVKAKKVLYSFDQHVIGDEKVEANFKKLAQLNQNVKWDRSKAFQLEYEFANPLVVFYKVYELKLDPSGNDVIVKK